MNKEIRMPDFGTTTDELRILRWLKKEGDPIKRGDILLEVETDKTITELESFAAGVLKKIVVQAETDLLAGDVIAIIGDE